MKKFIFLLLSLTSINAFSAVNDYVLTSSKILGQIQVNSGVYYFMSTSQNWDTPGCPNAQYAYIAETDPGAKAILSAALSAKGSQSLIMFAGLCGNSGGNDTYIRVSRIVLQ
jgi:hypothetical protein